MKYSQQEVMQFVEQEDVKFIRLAFCDVFGKQKNLSVMPGELARVFEYGAGLDASAVDGFAMGARSDLFLMPDLMRYDVKHSYIIELKYLSAKDSEVKAATQWQEAVEQIKGYAVGAKVRQMVHDTQLHCIVMQFRGWELERVEEV